MNKDYFCFVKMSLQQTQEIVNKKILDFPILGDKKKREFPWPKQPHQGPLTLFYWGVYYTVSFLNIAWAVIIII